jgi:tricorn protease-like protein
MNKFLALLALLVGCNKPSQVYQKPPEIVGERTNQQGVITQRIIRETSYTSEDVPFTPEGRRKEIDYQMKYFLEEEGGSRREFSIMRSPDFSNYERYWPMDGAVSWIGIGIDPVGNGDKLAFILFDERRIIRRRTFSVMPKWKSSATQYEFRNGNHTIILRSPEGREEYDIVADTTARIEK